MVLNFSLKCLILLLISSFLGFLITQSIAPKLRNNNDYIAVTLDKEKRLSELLNGKLIFIGGSNLCFGLDSKRISDSLKLPVVNMATHGGLGLAFILNEAINGVKENDIIIISTEYFLPLKGDLKLLTQLFDINPSASTYFINNFIDKTKYNIMNGQRCLSGIFYRQIDDTQPPPTIYKRENFTIEGDMIGHLDKKNPLTRSTLAVPKTVIDYSEEIDAINRFIRTSQRLKASVFYAFPCFPNEEYANYNASIDTFQILMQKGLKCKIINTPQTFLFDYHYFFDTIYHLNKEGREKRTETMIELLRNNIVIDNKN
jgi:hypothetical protein